jgi:hypothetical protein
MNTAITTNAASNQATLSVSDSGNSSQADGCRLEPTTTIADAVKALQGKRIDKDSLIDWLMATPFNLSQTGALVAVLTGSELGEVMARQQELTAASAAASVKSGGGGGGGNSLVIKIGKAGGLVMFGGKVAAAPNRVINLAACQALGILANGPAIIEAIERAAGNGSERMESRETQPRKDKEGNPVAIKQFSQPMVGALKVSSGEKYREMLAAAKAVYSG